MNCRKLLYLIIISMCFNITSYAETLKTGYTEVLSNHFMINRVNSIVDDSDDSDDVIESPVRPNIPSESLPNDSEDSGDSGDSGDSDDVETGDGDVVDKPSETLPDNSLGGNDDGGDDESDDTTGTVGGSGSTGDSGSSLLTYNISYDLQGGDWISNNVGKSVYSKLDYGYQPPELVRDGYNFVGWNPSCISSNSNTDLVFVAVWEEKSYNIRYNLDNGTWGESEGKTSYTKSDYGYVPPTPVKSNYTFTGWSPENITVNSKSDMVFTAQWKLNEYNITYDLDGGNWVENVGKTVYSYLDYGYIPPTPQKDGYTFTGWSLSKIPDNSVGDITFVASWSENVIEYNLTYDLGGGSWIGNDVGLSKYTKNNYGYIPPAPVQPGYKFKGWNPESIATGSASDIEFVALWEKDTVISDAQSFSASLKSLAAGKTVKYSANDNIITAISFVDEVPDGVDYITLTDDCEYPLYAYMDGTTACLATKAEKVYFNDCSYLFMSYLSLQSIDLSKFDTTNAKDMSYMFSGCQSLTSLDLSTIDTSLVTNMTNMFSSCRSLTSLDVSNLNTENVTSMARMFQACLSLETLDVSTFNTSKVTDMNNMFYSVSSATELNVSNFDTSNVTNMTEMFYDCSSLTSLDVSSFDTSKCTRMNNMFGYCKYLEELDLSNFNTSKVTLMTGMFEMCQRLTLLDLSNFNMKKVSSKSSMLSRTASVSRNCVIRCTSATETALSSGTSKNGYITFERPVSVLSLNLNGGSLAGNQGSIEFSAN